MPENKIQILRPFGPSIAKVKLTENLIEKLNNYVEKIIDDAKTLSGPRKASKKQIDKIIETCEKLSLDLDEFLRDNGIEDLENLTGGRDGSASVLIGKLFDIRGNNPATENQIKAIRNISKYLEIEIEDAMAIVKTTTIEEINFNDASELIGKLKKMKKK